MPVTVPQFPAGLDSVAGEFGLGRVRDITPVPGHRDVVRLAAERGVFLVRPAGPADPALYEQVAARLAQAGLRQAMPVRTAAGALVGTSGLVVQEFLPGTASLSPTPAQALSTMRHIGAYHSVLATISFPAAEPTLWTRVAEPRYLLAELPGRRLGDAVLTALDHLAGALPRIGELPRQLAHGDIGPDNVLMDGDDVVAVIDFTPVHQPVLFAVATAIYWYQVHGHHDLDAAAIGACLRAAGPWTAAERSAWPAMLLLPALQRLATPFAVAAASGADPSALADDVRSGNARPGPAAATIRRLDAVAAVVRGWPALAA